MKSAPPTPPTPPVIALSLFGLALIALSIYLAFTMPYSLWPWLLLLLGGGCAWAARRVR